MKNRIAVLALAVVTVLVVHRPAHSAIVYSDHVTSILRGNPAVGNFPGFYGGTFPGAFLVPRTQPQAEAAVVGAPNTIFLSLPGNEAVSPTPPGVNAVAEPSALPVIASGFIALVGLLRVRQPSQLGG